MHTKPTENEYLVRIHKVQDHIEANLEGDLSLDVLSDISGFSKFHFHRIFRGVVGETLLAYINRVRMERAVNLLMRSPAMTITDIAMALGFSDSAVFARKFKSYSGISASQLRKALSKNGQVESKNRKVTDFIPGYNEHVISSLRKDENMFVEGKVEVKTTEEIKALYLRHSGTFSELGPKFQGMIHHLVTWTTEKDVLDKENFKLFAVYHDNPEFTAEQNLKTSVCVAVKGEVKPEGEMGLMTIPSGRYAVGHFELDPDQHTGAWNYMYSQWLPQSGLQPAEGYVFEMYMNDPNTHPEKKHIVEIYLPVKAL